MTHEKEDDGPCIHPDDAYALAEKFEEMVDRLLAMDKIVPGAIASSLVIVDDVTFEISLKIKEANHA